MELRPNQMKHHHETIMELRPNQPKIMIPTPKYVVAHTKFMTTYITNHWCKFHIKIMSNSPFTTHKPSLLMPIHPPHILTWESNQTCVKHPRTKKQQNQNAPSPSSWLRQKGLSLIWASFA